MRGSPLLRALFAFGLIAALGWPLWHLTQPNVAVAESAAAPPPTAAKAIRLQLTFTTVPAKFTVRHLEKDVWVENAPQSTMERELPLLFPETGVDLVFRIEWPEQGSLAAARIRLTDPVGDVHEKSIWGKEVIDEVLTFP